MARRKKTFRKDQGEEFEEKEEKKPEFKYDGFGGDSPKSAKVPGKDRFFAQNFKHELMNDDAYAVCYQLKMNERDYNKVLRRFESTDIATEYEPHIKKFIEDTFIVKDDWDRFDRDLRSLSSKFRGTLFEVECFGEDVPNDIWSAYSLDGKYYQDSAKIVYPKFDREKLI